MVVRSVMYGFLYQITVLIHFLWILFLISGSLFGIKYRYIKYIHISGLVFAIFLQTFSLDCPLTFLENYFRRKANIYTYKEGFIAYYLEKLIYVSIEPYIIYTLTILLVLLHMYVYKKVGRDRR